MKEWTRKLPKTWFSRGARTGTVLIVLGAAVAWASDLPASSLSPAPAVGSVSQTPAEAARAYAGSPRGDEVQAAVARAEAAGVRPDLLVEVMRRAQDSDLPVEELLQVLRRAETLAKEDLPVWPVLSRYLQGMAKGVPPARVEAVVDELQQRLQDAAGRLDQVLPAPTDASERQARLAAIDDAAYALGVGVAPEDLDRFIDLAAREEQPLQAVQAPVLILGVLAASGLQPDKSAALVHCAWKHGYRGSTLERLGKALGRLGRDGEAPPETVVERVLAMLDQEAGPEQVFQGLEEMAGSGQDETYPTVEPGEGRGERPHPGRTPRRPEDLRRGNGFRERVARWGTSE